MIKEGMVVLHTRHKLICLANCSELMWPVVDTYKSDKLESDNEDAKRMKEAKKVADRKDQKQKKKQLASQRSNRVTGSRWQGSPSCV